MYPSPNDYAAMQSKLQKGLRILDDTRDEDDLKLGMALIQLHGAIEDDIRIEVAQKDPKLKIVMQDHKNTTWKELPGYAKDHLGFTDEDCSIVKDANTLRQKVAHGNEFTIRRAELVEYATFVERKCGQAQPGIKKHQQGQKAANLPSLPLQPSPGHRNNGLSGFVKLALYLVIFWIVCCLGGYLIWMESSPAAIQDMLHQFKSPFPKGTNTQTITDVPFINESTVTMAASESPAAEAACIVVWNEYKREDLYGKNRSMAWDKIVADQVRGSGMTAREFFDLVVEKNPGLDKDGYEFKKGKTYLLPSCQ